MKTILAALIAAGAVSAASVQPAFAIEQSRAAEIIFGKAYNDDVTAIKVAKFGSRRDTGGGQLTMEPLPVTIRQAQNDVSSDPALLAALKRRNIEVHNVLKVDTAMNGGHVVYYR